MDTMNRKKQKTIRKICCVAVLPALIAGVIVVRNSQDLQVAPKLTASQIPAQEQIPAQSGLQGQSTAILSGQEFSATVLPHYQTSGQENSQEIQEFSTGQKPGNRNGLILLNVQEAEPED